MSEYNDLTSQPSRFIVGIDLGTTNCSVGFVDTSEAEWRVRDFLVTQLVAANTVEAREVLPSFHYERAEGELAGGAMRLPWSSEEPRIAVGVLARDHGAEVPGRLISSAKSWLSHGGVDRTAALLPWHGAGDVERISPVEASARYLGHIRAAWDFEHREHPLSEQEVVLTVPASFDEVARELTVEAARRAGLVKLTLVEEPQAAFYAWINSRGDAWGEQVKAGQKILVIDVGGGTTDLTLINVRPAEGGKVLFHRVAVGEHLILGGDNLDLALAQHIEQKVTGGGKLAAGQWGPLVRACSKIKETLLGGKGLEKLTVNLAGGGAELIGGARQVEVTRAEVVELLVEGFMPRVGLDAKPVARRSGFQEFGLPYAADAGITRYLAAFLTAHGQLGVQELKGSRVQGEHDLARPDVVLINGGLFNSVMLRERIVEVISGWFSEEGKRKWKPKVLKNDRLDLAVSRGAAYYGMVRRGRGVRISGGLAHSYYVGVERESLPQASPGAAGEEGKPSPSRFSEEEAVCLLPAGVEEGRDVQLGRTFSLLIRQPVEFPLYVSATRTTDRPGAVVGVEAEQLTALPAIRTVLQSGRKVAADVVQVELHAKLTEIGTLELWAAEAKGDRRWKLQFDVRSATRAEVGKHRGEAEAQGVVEERVVGPGQALIRGTFLAGQGSSAEKRNRSSQPGVPGEGEQPFGLPRNGEREGERAVAPASLVKRLELVAAMSRWEWPASLMRSFWEVLMEVQEGRRISAEHEARWLNLVGFCLRPGYGLAVDDWRVGQVWRLQSQKRVYPRNEQCRGEWWVLWRRIAGGLSAGQQLTLAEPLVAAMKSRLRAAGPIAQGKTSPFQYGAHESAEVWRLLGSLELLKQPVKAELGELILELWQREKTVSVANAALFALGRLGQRVPVYGPLNCLVLTEVAERWAGRLMDSAGRVAEDLKGQVLFTVVQLARRSGDRYRDVSDDMRQRVLAFLKGRGAPGHYVELVEQGGGLAEEEQKLTFGESLPRGLRIE